MSLLTPIYNLHPPFPNLSNAFNLFSQLCDSKITQVMLPQGSYYRPVNQSWLHKKYMSTYWDAPKYTNQPHKAK